MERDELAATERSDAKILRKYARFELIVIDEWLTEDVDNVAIRFLLELVERRYMDRSTVFCTQYAPAEWRGRPGGGVQADAMVDRLVHGAGRIDLSDVNVRRLLSAPGPRAQALRVGRYRALGGQAESTGSGRVEDVGALQESTPMATGS